MRIRCVLRDGKPQWKLQCPGCNTWGDIDDDQLHGRVSVECTVEGCTFHETQDFTRYIVEEEPGGEMVWSKEKTLQKIAKDVETYENYLADEGENICPDRFQQQIKVVRTIKWLLQQIPKQKNTPEQRAKAIVEIVSTNKTTGNSTIRICANTDDEFFLYRDEETARKLRRIFAAAIRADREGKGVR